MYGMQQHARVPDVIAGGFTNAMMNSRKFESPRTARDEVIDVLADTLLEMLLRRNRPVIAHPAASQGGNES